MECVKWAQWVEMVVFSKAEWPEAWVFPLRVSEGRVTGTNPEHPIDCHLSEFDSFFCDIPNTFYINVLNGSNLSHPEYKFGSEMWKIFNKKKVIWKTCKWIKYGSNLECVKN